MTPAEYAIFDQHIEAGRTIVRFWNEWYQRDWNAPPSYSYGVIMEQRPYRLMDEELGPEDQLPKFWDDWFVCEWFEDPMFKERYEGVDMHLSHLEVCINNEWVRLPTLINRRYQDRRESS